MNYLTLACSGSGVMDYLRIDDVVVDTIGGTWNNDYYTLPDGIYIASITPSNTPTPTFMSGTTLNVKENGVATRIVQSTITSLNNCSLVDVIIAPAGTTVEIAFYRATSGACDLSARVVKMS